MDDFRRQALACPLSAAVEIIGDRWTFLIVRGAFNQLVHFEQFHMGLGIARNILADRLGKLVKGGILERRQDPTDGRCITYTLTEKGEGLMPTFLALRQWGEDFETGPGNIVPTDVASGKPLKKVCVLSADGPVLRYTDVAWTPRIVGHELDP